MSPNSQKQHLLKHVLTTTIYFILVSSAFYTNAQDTGISRTNRNLLTLSISEIDESCNVEELSVDWKGNDLNQSPIIINNPGECCEICQETDDCVAWLFRGAHNHCWLKYDIKEEVGCDQNDCISGIIRGDKIDEFTKYQQTDDVDYEKIYTSCDNSRNGMIVGAAMSACLKVKKQCGKPSEDNPEVPKLEITDLEWTCNYKYDTKYEIEAEDATSSPPDLTTYADCCRRCQSTRSCKAWTFTTKDNESTCNHFNVAPKNKEIKDSKGSTSGIKLEFDYVCSRHIYNKDIVRDSDIIAEELNVDSAEDCCNLCVEKWTSCVTWDYNTNNDDNICRGRASAPAYYEWDYKNAENVTSGTLVADPNEAMTQICSKISWDTESMKEEAYNYVPHYNTDCASVLEYGPGEQKDNCKNDQDAKDIFYNELDTLFEILIQYSS